MRYMFLLYIEDRPAPGTPEAGPYYAALMSFHQECRERGVLVRADPLQAPSAAKTVRVRAGKPLSTDGPFAETTEWLAGYFLLDCRDEDEALELARLCPVSSEGSVEIRPIWDGAASG